MDNLFLIVALGCLIALVVGIVKPTLVIKWGDEAKRSRKNVLKIYGLGLIVSFILVGVFAEDTNQSQVASNQTSTIEADEAKVKEEQAAKEAAEAKAKEEQAAKEADEAKAKEEQAAEQKAKNPMEQEWNTTDTDIMSNGNAVIAADIVNYYTEGQLRQLAEPVDETEAIKAVWKYYGKVIQIGGDVGFVTAYAPGSDMSIAFANGEECYEVHMISDLGVSVGILMIGDSASVKEGDYITVYGLPVGLFENENAYGGIVNELFLVGK